MNNGDTIKDLLRRIEGMKACGEITDDTPIDGVLTTITDDNPRFLTQVNFRNLLIDTKRREAARG